MKQALIGLLSLWTVVAPIGSAALPAWRGQLDSRSTRVCLDRQVAVAGIWGQSAETTCRIMQGAAREPNGSLKHDGSRHRAQHILKVATRRPHRSTRFVVLWRPLRYTGRNARAVDPPA